MVDDKYQRYLEMYFIMYTLLYLHIYSYSRVELQSPYKWNYTLLRTVGPQIKILAPDMGYLPLSCWTEMSQRSPKQHKLSPLLLLAHMDLVVRHDC